MIKIKIKWHWLIALIAIIIFIMASKALYQMVHTLDIAQMKSVIMTTPPLTMLKAIVVVILAYTLLSVYDLIAIRYLKVKIPYLKILNTSLTAFSLGHSLGVTMLSAGAVRFRYYGKYGIESAPIANIILLVSLAFSYGMMTVIGVSLLVNPHMLAQLLDIIPWFTKVSPLVFRMVGIVILALIMASIIFTGKLGRAFSIKHWQLHLPPATVLLKLILLAVIDISLVSYLIHILLPPSIAVSFLEVFSAYVQSITVGIISHVPGELGVFELSMVASLPQVDKTTLLSVLLLLLFRILYYIIPFALGLLSFFLHEVYIRSGMDNIEKRKTLPSVGMSQLLGLRCSMSHVPLTMMILGSI